MNRMNAIKESFPAILWLSVLCIYWIGIIRINFSPNPLLYCADMYSDLMYGAAAWQEQSIFPEGWVFGNQYYAVATPVLAALMFAFTDDPCTAMGIAATVMGLGVSLSFSWMLKPIFPLLRQRLAAVVLFMTAVLWCGDAACTVNGWQLFFTMCSYYACYAITAFLSIGCFLRRHNRHTPSWFPAVLLTCFFSFGTGIQSLRQTAITVIPILAAAGWETADCLRYHKPPPSDTLLLAGVLTLSNLLGLLYAAAVSAPKHEIFGNLSLSPAPDLLSAFCNLLGLFGNGWLLGLFLLAAAALYLVSGIEHWHRSHLLACLFLCLTATAVIFLIDNFTAMQIRSIYYFLLFPLAAVLFTHWFTESKTVSSVLAVGVLVLSLIGGRHAPQSLPAWQADHPLQAVCDSLDEHGISTLYTQWNLGGRIAVASGFHVEVGFWDAADDVFEPVEYLCDPAVFDAAPDQCAYLISGAGNLELAQSRAAARQAEILVIEYFPELDAYLCTSDKALME